MGAHFTVLPRAQRTPVMPLDSLTPDVNSFKANHHATSTPRVISSQVTVTSHTQARATDCCTRTTKWQVIKMPYHNTILTLDCFWKYFKRIQKFTNLLHEFWNNKINSSTNCQSMVEQVSMFNVVSPSQYTKVQFRDKYLRWKYIGWSDATESMVTIWSPFCGYNVTRWVKWRRFIVSFK